jgi:2-dehydro-3-deoxyphosphooctonate aldolase (KDO 8-P synthase)
LSAKVVKIAGVEVGGDNPLTLIAGPCVIESEELVLRTAERVQGIARRTGMNFIFKSSFDKANRTSVDNFRGPGIDEGLRILSKVRDEFGLPIISDIHTPQEALIAGDVLDCLQIPAFLCRQTDLLVAAGATGKPVNVKKGQFLAPEDMESAAKKVEAGGSGGVLFTERGTTFGYRYLVVDFQGMARMASFGRPIVFDATHSVQTPGGASGKSGGDREMVPGLSRAAAACGIDAIFIETHPDPDNALCDGPNSVALDNLEQLVTSVVAIDRARRETT